jgi:molybdopterin-guanine dinucleotide biosynthesis protein A
MERVSSAVLVGGKSRRMGTDKALLTVGGQRIIQRVIGALQAVADEVLLVGAGAERYAWLGGRTVDDLIPRGGPLAGLYTALSVARHSRCLVVACDMPFLNTDLLRYMFQEAARWDAVVPRWRGRLEPLHAVYARSCLEHIEYMLDSGDLCPLDLFSLVDVRYVETHEVASFDGGELSFANLNTPADLALARELGSGYEAAELAAAGGRYGMPMRAHTRT